MGTTLNAVEAGTKAAVKLKSKAPSRRDWKRLFDDVTERIESMSEALGEVLREQRERIPEVKEKAADVAENLREKVGDVTENVREKTAETAGTVREKATDAAGTVREKTRDAAEVIRDKGQSAAEVIRDKAGDAAETVKDKAPSFERKGRKRRRIMGLIFNRFTFGFGTGYVLGARAGRERYDQITQLWGRVSGNPAARQVAERGKDLAGTASRKVVSRVQDRFRSQSIRDVMTPLPSTIQTTEPAAEASRRMRQLDVGSLVVVDESGAVAGVLTDRDIVVRALAEGRDPNTTTVQEICSKELSTISPDDSVDDAVRLMREKSVRRLPVVEGGRPVGIVSIGDLAVERDRSSVLGDISADVPNR
jgi:CBS domain-containing protein